MPTEQEINNALLKKMINYISEATDMVERQFVLTVAKEDIKRFVLTMDQQFGLFNNWWKEKELWREAKRFLKNPNVKSISTLKQEVFGSISGTTYTLFFNLRCPSEHYYKTIRKKKMSYMIKQSELIYMRLEKYNPETQKDEIEYEQGFASVNDSPHSKIDFIH